MIQKYLFAFISLSLLALSPLRAIQPFTLTRANDRLPTCTT